MYVIRSKNSGSVFGAPGYFFFDSCGSNNNTVGTAGSSGGGSGSSGGSSGSGSGSTGSTGSSGQSTSAKFLYSSDLIRLVLGWR
jgi:hypothetical protein